MKHVVVFPSLKFTKYHVYPSSELYSTQSCEFRSKCSQYIDLHFMYILHRRNVNESLLPRAVGKVAITMIIVKTTNRTTPNRTTRRRHVCLELFQCCEKSNLTCNDAFKESEKLSKSQDLNFTEKGISCPFPARRE